MTIESWNFKRYNAAMFGQWLLEPHLCEFGGDKEARGKAGFIQDKEH
ncbi:MAG TPA: hypothetical protein VLJ61_05710 [Pyrinomonadaceae bacterium]|nr:hypothetical protein [Pyrinomonadaceae bacterium]